MMLRFDKMVNSAKVGKIRIGKKVSDTKDKMWCALSDTVKATTDTFDSAFNKKQPNKSDKQEPDDEADIKQAIKKLRGKDKLGVTGETLGVAGSAAAGAAAAGSIASALGVTTLLGSSSLASVLGGIFVTATPVGWVIGSAALAGATGYGIVKLVRSGSNQDLVRKELIERLTARLEALRNSKVSNSNDPLIQINQLMALLMMNGSLTEDSATRMIQLIEDGNLAKKTCLERIKSMALAEGLIELQDSQIENS